MFALHIGSMFIWRKAYKMRVVLHTLELEHCMGVVGFLAALEEKCKETLEGFCL